MEDWFWIVILAFFLLRLVLRAAKKKAGTEQRGSSELKEGPRPEADGANELHEFLDRLAGRSPGEEPLVPPPPPPSPKRAVRKAEVTVTPPPAKPPVPSRKPREEIETPDEPLTFSSNPLIQGIIFSELLGPPKGLRKSPGLPSDLAG